MPNVVLSRAPPKSRARSSWPFLNVLMIVIAIAFGMALFLPLIASLSISFITRDVTHDVMPIQIAHDVAESLDMWEPVAHLNPNYQQSIENQITGLRGFTGRDGFWGEGTDWYEFDLSPAIADRLRAALNRSDSASKNEAVPVDNFTPDWWPKQLPADVTCYEEDGEYLLLTNSGTHAWFMRPRRA